CWQRQVEREATAAPDGALDLNRAAEQFRQALGDRQAQTGSAVSAAGRFVGLGEGGEEPTLLFGGQSNARVDHVECQCLPPATVGGLNTETNLDPTGVGELGGVAHEVHEYLPNPH